MQNRESIQKDIMAGEAFPDSSSPPHGGELPHASLGLVPEWMESARALPPGKVYVANIGCVENALEASRLQAFFRENHWRMASGPKEADLVVVNTCGMSDAREQDSLHLIHRMCREAGDSAKVVVTGCLAAINPQSIADHCAGATMVSPREPVGLEHLIRAEVPKDQVAADRVSSRFLRPRLRNLNRVSAGMALLDRWRLPYPAYLRRVLCAFEQPDWHYVHISTGCIYRCAYCAIRLAKGRVSSRPKEQVIDQVRQGVQAGHRRVVLVGDDTSSYGLDTGSSLGELLCELVELPGDFTLYVRNIHPAGLLRQMDHLERAVASGKIGALTVPIQSGSDSLLRDMRRLHNLGDLLAALRKLSVLNPETLLLTHVLVGFPGETREDLRKTLRLIREFPFDGVAPDCYSARVGTEAASLPGQIGSSRKTLRYWRANASIIYRVYLNSLRWRRPAAHEARVSFLDHDGS